MKILKKLLIIIPLTIAAIFLILLVTPLLFKGKILEIAKKELNKRLTAQVDFSDVKLSFIRNFPDAYAALENVTVTGTGEFEGETLVKFKSLSIRTDIISVIKMENIRVKSVLLDSAKINAHISEKGGANWNIMKPKDAPPVDAVPSDKSSDDKAPSPLTIALNKFEIRGADISFQDDSRGMTAAANGLNFLLYGDMTLDKVDLNMKLDIADLNFRMKNINMLTKARAELASRAAADFKNMAFSLKETRFSLNDLILKFAGSLRISNDINIDMIFTAEKTDFKSVLGLVPTVYMKNLEKITTTGSFALSGYVKGTYNDKQTPNAGVNLTIENAMFKYPDLPKSVNNINIKANAYYDGEVFDRTTLDVEKLRFETAGNPFEAELCVKTPASDMQVAAKFLGKIDFDSLLDIIPLDDAALKGLLECDFALAGRMSALENRRYEDFDAKGTLKLSRAEFKKANFPQAVKISNAQINFTPKKIDLVNFDSVIGNSDIAMNGALENFIPFVFKGGTVSGNLNLKSAKIDLNEFMGSKEKTEKPKESSEKPEDSSSMSVIEAPKNIDFAVKAGIGRLLFKSLDISGVAGDLSVKDGKLKMRNLSMNMLEGNIALSGEYNTQYIKVPSIIFNADIARIDAASAIASFEILQKILPLPQNYAGKVSANISLNTILDEHLSPVLNTLSSKGRLRTHNLRIQNSELFAAMANLLKNETWRTPTLNNININYEIKEGRLAIEPIRMNVARTSLEITGSQGLDMSLDYKVNAAAPVSAIGSGAADLLSKIPGGSKVTEIKVTGLIKGTPAKPAVTLSSADMANNAAATVKEVVKEQAQAVKKQAKEEIDKQISAVMAEAEKQAQSIRNTAKQTADKIRAEADAKANQLEAAAKQPWEKTAAKIAADKLRDEGKANAAKVEQEAEKQAAAVMDNARKKADEIRK